eukprot:CAMPEP_0172391304 /NCGR_PEP_ID=MMETSP1061-20121228/7736_1 /TAXON_ID=37318 /ORGANISM="Pseudo-nitzschia pungens, Strain cf. pungens" /LENGTH=73 /DNA_ID=CAMNT_0013121893 /DNA_START=931 /DNA_END=1152 /DNA_ORIENTATION=-
MTNTNTITITTSTTAGTTFTDTTGRAPRRPPKWLLDANDVRITDRIRIRIRKGWGVIALGMDAMVFAAALWVK